MTLRGKVQITSPQRQFENLKITYEFENEAEKEDAVNAAMDDLIIYHNMAGRKANAYSNGSS